jgi:hypothetical protein
MSCPYSNTIFVEIGTDIIYIDEVKTYQIPNPAILVILLIERSQKLQGVKLKHKLIRNSYHDLE